MRRFRSIGRQAKKCTQRTAHARLAKSGAKKVATTIHFDGSRLLPRACLDCPIRERRSCQMEVQYRLVAKPVPRMRQDSGVLGKPAYYQREQVRGAAQAPNPASERRPERLAESKW